MNKTESRQKFPVYLYVKTHNHTGFKYFGRTIQPNPEKYRGSGKWWLRHLKVHGNDVTTEIVATFHSSYGLHEFATAFSKYHKIVESNTWANLIVEDGFGGGFGPISVERKLEMSKESSSRKWYTNGIEQRFLKVAPPGWLSGRLPSSVKGKSTSLKGRAMSEEDKQKRRKPHDKTKSRKPNPPKTLEQRGAMKSKRWWTDGAVSVFLDECPAGFTAGRTLPPYDRHPHKPS